MYVEQLIHAQKMETIGNLAGGIAHEFNNILTIIIGNNELIQNDFPVGSDARSSSEAIQKAGLRARDVVTQLLTFSRLEKAEKSVINTGSIVRESLELIRSTTSANIHIDQNIEENIFPILGNETQLSQLIINLCSNARDAIENTEGTIVVNLCNRVVDNESDHNHESLAPGKYVKLQVSDDGMGMEKQTLSNIYDPYFTTKEFGKGTGIGLSVVHGIIQGYGGLIFVDSKLNIGTTFTIYLPAHVKECKDSHGAITYTPIGDFTILVVDDEPEIIRVGKRYLESLGYIVVSTIDPIKALEIIRKNPNHFDLIISDLEMPKMTGKHLLGEVLKICPGIKTILCTGYSVNFTNNDALAMGVDAFLMKPFTKSELAQKVSEVIDTEKQ